MAGQETTPRVRHYVLPPCAAVRAAERDVPSIFKGKAEQSNPEVQAETASCTAGRKTTAGIT